MKLLKKLRIEIALFSVCVLIIAVETAAPFAGEIINNFYPCFQNTEIVNSMPCYMKYDILILLNAYIVAASVLVISAVKVIRYV